MSALVTAAAVAGGSQLASAGLDAYMSVNSAKQQMQFQRDMGRRQQHFAERMSNTQMQRRVADLRAAAGTGRDRRAGCVEKGDLCHGHFE